MIYRRAEVTNRDLKVQFRVITVNKKERSEGMNKFSIQTIQGNILVIREEFYQEYANIFLFVHDKDCLLFDCGLGFRNLKDYLIKLGFKNFKVVLTHAHFDHAGGINQFNPMEIWLTPHQLKNLKNPEMLGLNYLRASDFKIKDFEVINFCNNFGLNLLGLKAYEEETIEFFGYRFKLIDTPGHTDDSICFWEEARGILITGDTLYRGEPYVDLINSSIPDLGESLAVLTGLKAKLILPGHNEILSKEELLEVINSWRERF